MTVDRGEGPGGTLPLELLESGDPAFVEAIRAVDDADALADFAGTWYEDSRPESRRLLLEYLERPLNAYRHEGLVKRLFKRAEAAGDDQAMARFLVLFDRSIRRRTREKFRYETREVADSQQAQTLKDAWIAMGYRYVRAYETRGGQTVYGQRFDELIVHPRRTTMPSGRMIPGYFGKTAPEWAVRFGIDWHRMGQPRPRDLPTVVEKLKGLRLFTVATRCYLRRRAWRYFRNLGRTHPDRYIAGASEALSLFRNEDVADGLALIDNWGLTHILFHHCPALEARVGGWTIAPGRSLAELAPSPIFESLWAEATGTVVGLLARARCRTVVQWAIRRIQADPSKALAIYPLEGWIDLLGHDDPEIAGLSAEILREAEGLDAIGTARWLGLVESSSPSALDVVCELAARYIRPEEIAIDQAARLAGLRPLPVARLGLSWIQAKVSRGGEADPILLGLVEAGCVPLRGEILRWVRSMVEPSPDSILAFLDSRHADARREGWDWFQAEPMVRDDVETWRKLLESPHDDVRLTLVADLEARIAGGDPSGLARAVDAGSLLGLWAAVLLNVHRGSRARPPVVRQILRRLEANPDEAPRLLPLLGVALRSVRGPERRAGLVAVVGLVERRAEVEPLVRSTFPELIWK
ncbi:hypothetical protein P12x_002708 [Tundrisphaera lichenicola]|uniref:hypothetical protein n=1 Tax=Tundrisphaera lichenicola TaxID=2029860 RepID=UPI003EC08D07